MLESYHEGNGRPLRTSGVEYPPCFTKRVTRTEAVLGLRFGKVQRLLPLYFLKVLSPTILEVWLLSKRDLKDNGESPTFGSQVEFQRAQDQCRGEVTFPKELLWGTQGTKTKDISC